MRAETTREWFLYKQAVELSSLSGTKLQLIKARKIKAARIGWAVRTERYFLQAITEQSTHGSEGVIRAEAYVENERDERR
jgi:hypothetical protein